MTNYTNSMYAAHKYELTKRIHICTFPHVRTHKHAQIHTYRYLHKRTRSQKHTNIPLIILHLWYTNMQHIRFYLN